MIKAIVAIGIASFVAGAVVALPGLSNEVVAGTPEQAQAAPKGDRLDIHLRSGACVERGWPYYDRSCLRGSISDTKQAKTIRIVSTDRKVN